MTSAAGRKKSQIDLPVAHNTLLNKAASQSTSLYQQCSALRTRLLRVHDFTEFFTLSSSTEPSSSRRSTDPVTQLWDCFAMGIPLCYLFNLLPAPFTPINIDTNPKSFDTSNERTRKHSILLFSMQIRQVDGCEQFTVRDLLDRNSTDGFVKVVNNVIVLVDHLPEEAFIENPPSSPPTEFSAQDSQESLTTEIPSVPRLTAQENARSNIVKELLETERKYVQDLEVLQKYSLALSQSNTIDLDTIHLLFPNLNKLLNFQRKFLIKLESIAELPWNDQRWGDPFSEQEEEFAVYEPYCANYTMASEIMLQEEQNLTALNQLINAKSELPAFLIKPVQRICKYPLLLESLLKNLTGTEYRHLEELRAGLAAAKRVTDKINEAQRRAENAATVKNLEGRVEDWKGHHLSNFGALLLDDIFSVTKSEVDREYHVFLFEKIILCCKEYIAPPTTGKKVGKSNSILKKPATPILPSLASAKKKNTPLLLKGRIFLNNVTKAVPKITAGQYSLAVWWRGDDDLEYFTLRCRNEEQLKMWENQLNRMIQETASRRGSERNLQRLVHISNSTNPAPNSRPIQYTHNEKTFSVFSQVSYSSTLPPHPGSRDASYPPHERGPMSAVSSNGSFHHVQGYPDGFDQEEDYEDYPLTSTTPTSGRGTPIGHRSIISPTPHSAALLNGRPSISRSVASDTGSFGNGLPQRVTLRSQFSSTKLKAAYDRGEPLPNGPSPLPLSTQAMRSRSASQPSAYMPKQVLPPLPTAMPWADRSQSMSTTTESKRGSGSSQSTGDSSDSSAHIESPITPYGSSESSLAGMSNGRLQQLFQKSGEEISLHLVKVKVHFHEDIFVIQVPRTTEYRDLVDKVGKKIRLCGPRREDGPLRLKYTDEDGDLVSLGSTEDVQMAFESFRPGNQVTLHVS